MDAKRWTVFYAARYDNGVLAESFDMSFASGGHPVMVPAADYDALRAEFDRVQAAHDHQYEMAGLMLREAERNGRERDEAVAVRDSYGDLIAEIARADYATRRAVERLDEAVALLRTHGRHLPTCDIYAHVKTPTGECDCGLGIFLAKIKEGK